MIKTSSKPEIVSLSQKVVNKLVRVLSNDGREFLAIFGSIDKSGALFIQDSLEVIRTDFEDQDCLSLRHDCYTPYLLNLDG